MTKIKTETSKDETVNQASTHIINGWPNYLHQVQENVKFGPYREELSLINGIIFKGELIYSSFKNIALPHQGHLGKEKMKLRTGTGFGIWKTQASDNHTSCWPFTSI